jgi:hypothetical protein
MIVVPWENATSVKSIDAAINKRRRSKRFIGARLRPYPILLHKTLYFKKPILEKLPLLLVEAVRFSCDEHLFNPSSR